MSAEPPTDVVPVSPPSSSSSTGSSSSTTAAPTGTATTPTPPPMPTAAQPTASHNEEAEGEGVQIKGLGKGESKSDGEEEDGRGGRNINDDEEREMERLTSLLMERLMASRKESGPPLDRKVILPSLDLAAVAAKIKDGTFKNIIVMTGAGISVSAGIPDFRTPGSGLYYTLQRFNLPNPEAIFELSYFLDNPEPFFRLAKEMYPGKFRATTTHYFLRLLAEKGVLLRCYTQNIDTLELVAGIPSEKLIFAHGSFASSHCTGCHEPHDIAWVKEEIFADKVPKCSKCGGLVKPDIVFFGESLPPSFHQGLKVDFPQCDLLIILGTSLVVQPFASLVDRVGPNVPRLLINREKAGNEPVDPVLALLGIAGGGLDFDSPRNYRDVFWQGDCDDGSQELARLLGWEGELDALIEAGRIQFQTANEAKPSTTTPTTTTVPSEPPTQTQQQTNTTTPTAPSTTAEPPTTTPNNP
ncbi:NAD-dependent protein deacetylase sirtuin-2 [Pelomyxa schiedti]|nr:NAD-dependent protein deacetylase sirtuin-2 [Pelomyxa schiedti]